MGTAAVVVDGATLGPVASSTGVTDVELVRGVGSEVDDPEVVGVGDGPVEPDEPEPEDPEPDEPPELVGDAGTVTVTWLDGVVEPS